MGVLLHYDSWFFSSSGRNNLKKITFFFSFMGVRKIEFNIHLSVREQTTERQITPRAKEFGPIIALEPPDYVLESLGVYSSLRAENISGSGCGVNPRAGKWIQKTSLAPRIAPDGDFWASQP